MTSRTGTGAWLRGTGLAALAWLGLGGCDPGPTDLFDVQVGEVLLEKVVFENHRGESVQALYAAPERAAPGPAVIVLHGSGGLMDPPGSYDDDIDMGTQFQDWAQILYRTGYAVLMPDSFASRGFYEWDDAPGDLDLTDRLIMRVYDAHAALAFACAQPGIDCGRVAVLGFSNGGSAAAFSMHAGLEDLPAFADLPPASERPGFALGIPYYPGCRFDGLLGTDTDDPAEFYRPSAPVHVQHGDGDELFAGCEDRLAQTEVWVQSEGLTANPFHLYVYDAGHGFDSHPVNAAEEAARVEARELTLDLLAAGL